MQGFEQGERDLVARAQRDDDVVANLRRASRYVREFIQNLHSDDATVYKQ